MLVVSSRIGVSERVGEGAEELESERTKGRYQFLRGPDDFQNRCCWTCLLTLEAKEASVPVLRDRLGERESLLTKR